MPLIVRTPPSDLSGNSAYSQQTSPGFSSNGSKKTPSPPLPVVATKSAPPEITTSSRPLPKLSQSDVETSGPLVSRRPLPPPPQTIEEEMLEDQQHFYCHYDEMGYPITADVHESVAVVEESLLNQLLPQEPRCDDETAAADVSVLQVDPQEQPTRVIRTWRHEPYAVQVLPVSPFSNNSGSQHSSNNHSNSNNSYSTNVVVSTSEDSSNYYNTNYISNLNNIYLTVSDEEQPQEDFMHEGEEGEGHCPLQQGDDVLVSESPAVQPIEKSEAISEDFSIVSRSKDSSPSGAFLHHNNAPLDAIIPTFVSLPSGFGSMSGERPRPGSHRRSTPLGHGISPTVQSNTANKPYRTTSLSMLDDIPATAHRPRKTYLFSSGKTNTDDVLRYLREAGRSLFLDADEEKSQIQTVIRRPSAKSPDGEDPDAPLPSERPRVSSVLVRQHLSNVKRRNEFASAILQSATSSSQPTEELDLRDVTARLRAPFNRISSAAHVSRTRSDMLDVSTRQPAFELEVITRRRTCRGMLSPFAVSPGDGVIIEQERGQEDFAIVRRVRPKFSVDQGGHCTVLRRAVIPDYLRRHIADEREAAVLAFLKSLTNERFRDISGRHGDDIPMDIDSFEFVDVEAQIDLERITIFYCCQTGRRTSFRPLLQIIFKLFNCRIWMEYVPAPAVLPSPTLLM